MYSSIKRQSLTIQNCNYFCINLINTSQVVLMVKNPPANVGDIKDVGSIPGSEISPGEGNCNPLQCSCLENSMDKGAWWAIVHRVAKGKHDWVTNTHRRWWKIKQWSHNPFFKSYCLFYFKIWFHFKTKIMKQRSISNPIKLSNFYLSSNYIHNN